MTYIPTSVQLSVHSADKKPVNFPKGSVVLEVDTGKHFYVNDAMEWNEATPENGGGGGGPHESTTLEGKNPMVMMKLDKSGTAAQMQVLDKETGHLVANLEYLKSSQSLSLDLFDRITGAVRTSMELKHNGKAYIDGVRVVTAEYYTYDFAKLQGPKPVHDETWQDMLVLNTPERVPGVYELKWEILFTTNAVDKSAKFRYSIDDGANWAVLTRRVLTVGTEGSIDMWFPYEITTKRNINLKVQVAKGDISMDFTCLFGSIVAKRVK